MDVLAGWKAMLGDDWDRTYAASNALYVARQNNILNNDGQNNNFVTGNNNTTNSGTENFGGPTGGQGAGAA